MGGYKDIMRAVELKAEYDKFMAYKAKTKAEKQTAYSALNVRKLAYNKQSAYIAPFLQPAKSLFILLDIPATGQTEPCPKALDFASTYYTITAPTGTTNIIIEGGNALFPKNKLGKIIVKTRVTTATTNSQSRITDRYYKRHETNSVSMFIGKNAAADDYGKVAAEIKAKASYKTFVGVVGNTVQFIPEG